jgi:hypothetical protein
MDHSTETRTPDTHGTDTRRLGWWWAGGLAVVASVVANLAILGIGTLADASFVVVDNGDPADVDVAAVLFASIVPLAAGFVVAALLDRWRPGLVRPLGIVVAALAVVSVAGPFAADTDTGTAVALAVMHLVVGAAYLGGIEAARHRAPAAGVPGSLARPAA